MAECTIPICITTAAGFLILISYGGWLNGHGIIFFISVVVAGAILFKRLSQTNIDRPEDCRAFFLDTPLVGNVVLMGLVVDSVFRRFSQGIPF